MRPRLGDGKPPCVRAHAERPEHTLLRSREAAGNEHELRGQLPLGPRHALGPTARPVDVRHHHAAHGARPVEKDLDGVRCPGPHLAAHELDGLSLTVVGLERGGPLGPAHRTRARLGGARQELELPHRAGALAHGRAQAVVARVAAANDHHVPALGAHGRCAAVEQRARGRREVVHGPGHATRGQARLEALRGEAARPAGPRRDHHGVEVGEQDELSVPADTALAEGIEIEVGRVTYREYTKTETIPFETTIKYTNIIAKGATKVSRKGQTGVKTYTYRERIVNGEVAQTTLVSEKVTKAAVDQVNLVGTVAGVPLSKAPYEIELDEKGHPVNYKTVYTGKATAYTNEGGRLSKYTASGRLAQVGVVGVDPRKIPYGTELYIVSPSGSYVYGYAIAGDTGPGVRNGSLITDVFMDTVEECRQFGGRTMMVYVLK